jgi:hypothetical protein
MKHDVFTRFMEERGFHRVKHPLGYSPAFQRTSESVVHYVIRDNVRGGAFRLFLGHDCTPAMAPLDSKRASSIEAESPWFEYIEGFRTREEALQDCVDFMKRVGVPWLTNPMQRSHEYWMLNEKMLISVGGVRLMVPRPPRVLP